VNNNQYHPELQKLIAKQAQTTLPVDEEIIPLLDALLSLPGISTFQSCAGHGRGWPQVQFGITEAACGLKSLEIIRRGAEFYDWYIVVTSFGHCRNFLAGYTLAPSAGFKESVGKLHPSCVINYDQAQAEIEMNKIPELAHHIKELSKSNNKS
jgi:hypothetical protein